MKRILLLEDDENLNRGISIKLSREGYHVFSAGTILEAKFTFSCIFKLYKNENMVMFTVQGLIQRGEVQLLVPWIYLLAIGVAMITVFVSLLRPMKIAAKVSEIEAMLYRGEQTTKNSRKGYSDITVTRLAMIHLAGNKKKV